MKLLYTLLFAFLFAAAGLAKDPARGYIVTKNGKQLTGYIGDIYYSEQQSIVVFINDFGSVYNIEAERIRGFVLEEDKGYAAFESKNCYNHWYFLRILEKGKEINLYKSPEQKIRIEFENGMLKANSYNITEFWLEVKGRRQPIRIHRLNFKRKLKRLFRKAEAPKFRDKVGAEGYHFKDLPNIIREFNRERSIERWHI